MIAGLLIGLLTCLHGENEWAPHDIALTSSRKHHSFTFVGVDGYSYGGFDSNNKSTTDLHRYSVEAHSFSQVTLPATIPELRYHAATEYQHNDKLGLFIAGGLNTSGYSESCAYHIDTTSGTSKQLNLPVRMHGQSMASFNDSKTILIWGGAQTTSTGTSFLKKFYVLYEDGIFAKVDIPAEATDLASLGTSLVFWKKESRSYVFLLTGGHDQQTKVNQDMWKVTLTENGESFTVSLQQVFYHPIGLPIRSYATSFIVGSNLIIYGGSSSTSDITVVNLDSEYFSWSRISPSTLVTPSLTNGAAAAYDSKTHTLVTFGGEGSDGKLSTQLFEIKLEELLKHSNCIDCTTAGGIWCASLQRCLTKGESGPEYEQCSIRIAEQNKCPSQKCSSRANCSTCLSDLKCGWCQTMEAYPYSISGCVEGGAFGPSYGNCFVYTQNSSKCSSLKPELVVNEPESGDVLFLNTTVSLKWYTRGDNVDSFRYNIYIRPSNAPEEEILVRLEVPHLGQSTYRVLPNLEAGAYQVVFKLFNPATQTESVEKTVDVTVAPLSIKFSSPVAGQEVVADTLVIKWEYQPAVPKVTLTLKKGELNHTLFLFNADNAGSYTWKIDAYSVKSGDDYAITLHMEPEDSSSAPKLIGTTGMFSVVVPELEYELVSPTAADNVQTGKEVTVAWKTNRYPDFSVVSLCRGSVQNPTSCIAIDSFVPYTETSVKWVVDVDVKDNAYFFRVADGRSDSHVDSFLFPLERTSLIPNLSFKSKDYTLSLSEKTVLTWDYFGVASTFTVTLFSDASETIVIASKLESTTRRLEVTIPSTLKHDTAYLFSVAADDHPHKLFGYSQPFVAISPGSTAVLAVPSLIFTTVIAASVSVFAVLFWLCWYKRKRISGFQQL
ncbi:hypothetical protein BLNAU_3668 [Blattamonas nauphoetae]|uniref:Yeast cell wall synthesis Kre9/Knh1-like N-terminal domain-containing protein n=1 Tax=Blattamonas nauphoetae TaxID=2049346 RepID=A0ABQ9YBU9_9EUKA|nr:hypothetical protein BLNAU_3668 [Blattamonas nauphoetae]